MLETHGKHLELSQRVVTMQAALRERFQDIQNSRNSTKVLSKPQSPTINDNQNVLRGKIVNDKKFGFTSNQFQKSQFSGANADEMIEKVLKRIRDSIERNFDQTSEVDLTRHIFEIRVSIF